jgi:phospholipase/carboxylesterase
MTIGGSGMELQSQLRAAHLLPGRFGPRPRSSAALPFRQLDQFPPAELQQRLYERCVNLPGVRTRQSRVATPQSRALCLADRESYGPPEAFIDGREFCHIHPLPEGSIHLTLPIEEIETLVALGWVERHPIQSLGLFHNLVMVYGPRDVAELEIVFSLVELSCRFAKGARARVPSPVPVYV